jgi:hypothetical protein
MDPLLGNSILKTVKNATPNKQISNQYTLHLVAVAVAVSTNPAANTGICPT